MTTASSSRRGTLSTQWPRSATTLLTAALLVGVSSLLAACGGGSNDGKGADSAIGPAPRRADGTIIDDHALCDFKDRKDVELGETASPGAVQPNVRRVWKVFGNRADRRRVLVCREADTNLDGYKDVVRFYDDEGQSREERADTNFDGKIDTWNIFAGGRLAEVRLDKNHDGHIDEWKTYLAGKLVKVKRDSNFDRKADIWEMYRGGHLERMGVDVDGDERVDRWDYDAQRRRARENALDRKRDEDDKRQRDELDRRRKEAEKTADEG